MPVKPLSLFVFPIFVINAEMNAKKGNNQPDTQKRD